VKQNDSEMKSFSTRLSTCERNFNELSQHGKQIQEIESKMKNLVKTNQDLEGQLSTLKTLSSSVETIKRNSNENKVKIESVEKKIVDRKDEMDTFKKMHNETGKQVETIKTELKQVEILANKINTLEKATAKSSQDIIKVKSLEKSFETNEKEISACKKLTDNHYNEIQKLKTKVTDLLSKNWQFKIDDLDKKLEAKIETSLKKSNENFSILSDKIQSQEKTVNQVEKDLSKSIQLSSDATRKSCEESLSILLEEQKRSKKQVADLETNYAEFSNLTSKSIRDTKKMIEGQNNALKETCGNTESFQIDALVQFKKIEEMEAKLKTCTTQGSQLKQDLIQHQNDSSNDLQLLRLALESSLKESEQSKKQFETQLLTQVDLKLSQVESGIEECLKKMESDIMQANSSYNQTTEKVEKNCQEFDLKYATLVNDHLIEQKKVEIKISNVEMKQDELENSLSKLEVDRQQILEELGSFGTEEQIDLVRKQVEESVRVKALSITEKLGLVSLSLADLKENMSRTLDSNCNEIKKELLAEQDLKWKQIFFRQQETYQIVQESCDEIQSLNKIIGENGSSILQTKEDLSSLQERLSDIFETTNVLQSQLEKLQCSDLNVIQEKLSNLQLESKGNITSLREDWDNDRKNFMDGIGKVSREVSERYSDLVNIYNKSNQEYSDMNLRLKNAYKIIEDSTSDLEHKITEDFEEKLNDSMVEINERIASNVEMFKMELESKSCELDELKRMMNGASSASHEELKGLIAKIDSNCELRNDEIQQMVGQQQLQSREHIQRLEDELYQRIDESCSQLNKKSLEHLVNFRSEVNVSIKTMQQTLKEIDMFAQKVNAESMSNHESLTSFTSSSLEEIQRKIAHQKEEISHLYEIIESYSENSRAKNDTVFNDFDSEIKTIKSKLENFANICQAVENSESESRRKHSEFQLLLDELILSKDFLTNDLFKLREESKAANEETFHCLEVKIEDHLKELQLKQENFKSELKKIKDVVKELGEVCVSKNTIDILQGDVEKLQDHFSSISSKFTDIKLSQVDFQTKLENNQILWEEKLSDKTAQLENLTKIVESQEALQGKVSNEAAKEFQNRLSSFESSLNLLETNFNDKQKLLVEKVEHFETNVLRVENKCEEEKSKIYGEISFSVKSLNENLRHR